MVNMNIHKFKRPDLTAEISTNNFHLKKLREKTTFIKDCLIEEERNVSCSTIDVTTCNDFKGAPVMALNTLVSMNKAKPGQEKFYLLGVINDYQVF